jgi:hypothetical protein
VAGLVGALRSGDADAGGRRVLGVLADLELHALPLLEAAEARGVDFGVVDKTSESLPSWEMKP